MSVDAVDIACFAGSGCIVAGIWMLYGVPVTLIVLGCLLLTLGVVGLRK